MDVTSGVGSPIAQIRREQPFPYMIVDGAFDAGLVHAASEAFPPQDWAWPVNYQSPLEKKRACNDWKSMPVPVAMLMSQILRFPAKLAFTEEQLPGASTLIPDCTLWGGGMHAMGRGDHLDLHEDSDHHLQWQWSRRVNAVLYLNKVWEPDWGGELEFWDTHLKHCSASILPKFNRLVLFRVGDHSYHGVPEPLTCPEDVQRMSLAAFWFSPPTGPFKRPRAKFVARPGDPADPIKDALRKSRSEVM